jgi:hypothetical protein
MEAIEGMKFSISVKTNQQTITREGETWEALGDAIDDLAELGYCPFETAVDDEDAETDLDDEYDELEEKSDIFHDPIPPKHED